MTKYSKRDHEKFIAINLVGSLNLSYKFERMGNDENEPDVIFKDNDKSIGIEICVAYYDNTDAKQEWTLARGDRQFPSAGYEHRFGGVISEPDNLICSKIQAELNDKCSKSYSGVDESWLCIEVRAPLSDEESLNKCISELKIPKSFSFKYGWLYYHAPLHEGNGYKAIEIINNSSGDLQYK